MQVVVKRLRTSQPDVVLQKDDSVDIRVNDQVAVEDTGRGLLRFPDGLTVEILKQTQLSLGEVRLMPDGFVLTRIKQTAWPHSRRAGGGGPAAGGFCRPNSPR